MPTEPGAINGGMMKRSADTPSPVLTIGVDSIDDSMKKIEAAGGSVVQPRTEIPDMGAFAYFKDTEGNVLGLWENADRRAAFYPLLMCKMLPSGSLEPGGLEIVRGMDIDLQGHPGQVVVLERGALAAE